MKEATGELNITVITVIAIAAIAALFYAFVWPMIENNLQRSTRCANAFSCTDCNGETCSCSYYDDDNSIATELCPDNSTR